MRKSYFLASYKKVKGACLFLKSYLRWKSLGIRVLCTHSFNHPSNYWVPTVLGGGTSPKGSVCPHRTFILVVKTEPELLDSDQRRIRWEVLRARQMVEEADVWERETGKLQESSGWPEASVAQMLGEKMFRLRAGSHGPGVRKCLACFRDRSF